MKTNLLLTLSFTIFAGAVVCAESTGAADLVVSAAASLQESFVELKSQFEQEHPGDKVLLNFGGSGALATQIKHGAVVDVFASADDGIMHALVSGGTVEPSSVKEFARNSLVVITGIENGRSFHKIATVQDLVALSQVAVGNPETVPAGRYAANAFKHEKIESELTRKHALVFGENVRQVLAYVEGGNVDAGLVYATDAKVGHDILVQCNVPSSVCGDIIYPIAVVKASLQKALAEQFIALVGSRRGQSVLQKRGFKTESP